MSKLKKGLAVLLVLLFVRVALSAVPTADNPTLTPSGPRPNQDLICEWNNIQDSDGDTTRNVTLWHKDGSASIEKLYYPFEGNGYEDEWALDYSSMGYTGFLIGTSGLKVSFDMLADTNSYVYRDLKSTTNYVIQSNDCLMYEIMWTTNTDEIAFDYTTYDNTKLRDAGYTDQNGLNAHPSTDISSYAYLSWYERKIDISGHSGKTIQYYDLACEHDTTKTKTGYFKNIRIVDCTSESVNKVIYDGGAYTHAKHINRSGSVNTFGSDYETNGWSSTGGKVYGHQDFDGIDDFVEVGSYSIIDGETEASMCFWLNYDPATVAQDAGLITKWGNSGNGWLFFVDDTTLYSGNTDTLSFVVDSPGGASGRVEGSTGLITPDQWDHYCGVFKGGQYIRLYKNGMLDSETTSSVPGTMNTSSYSIRLGNSMHSSLVKYLNGSLDEVRVYDTALSDDQIEKIYNSESVGKYPQTLSYTMTSLGEDWMCSVKPNDGSSDGTRKYSSSSTIIANNVPTHDSPTLSPKAPITLQNLTCTANNVQDSDGDDVMNITTWYKDGSSIFEGYYPFEGNDNPDVNTKDYSGYERNATVHGAAWISEGKVGSAYDFNGYNDYIDLGDIADNGGEFTWTFWVNPSDLSENVDDQTKILSQGGLSGDRAYQMTFGVSGGGVCNAAGVTETCFAFDPFQNDGATRDNTIGVSADNFTVGQWSFVAITYSVTQDSMKIYIDGELKDSATIIDTVGFKDTSYNLYVATEYTQSLFFDGIIDEVKIFKRALSSSQIKKEYQSGQNSQFSSTIVSEETSVGEDWQCEVTPNDHLNDGTPKTSSTQTVIVNSPPTHSAPIIDPSTPHLQSDLVCLPQSVSDVDGHDVQNITIWLQDGNPLMELYFPFEQEFGSDTIKDFSGHERNGSTYKVSATTGISGDAFYFDSSSKAKISVPYADSPSLSGNLTLEAWVYLEDYNSERFIISRYNYADKTGYSLGVTSGEQVLFKLGDDTDLYDTYGNGYLTLNEWHHIVAVYDGESATIYVDGEVNGTSTPSQSIVQSSTNLTIGYPSDSTAYYNFNGKIDEVRVYDIALTSAQVNINYQAGLQGIRPSILDGTMTQEGSDYVCSLTPFDGLDYGITKNSTAVTVVDLYGSNSIDIMNLGVTGFEQTNPEYTSLRSVFLNLVHESGQTCRYTNYPTTTEPPQDYSGWTNYEPCIDFRAWILSENSGVKTVFYQINYSDTYGLYYDTINYNYTGSGLDVTPPTKPVIVHKNFTNDNNTISFSWYNASDPESEVLGISLDYYYEIYTDQLELAAYTEIYETDSVTINIPLVYDFTEYYSGIDEFSHGTTYYINLSAINTAGLKSNASNFPLGTTVDVKKPYSPTISGYYGSTPIPAENTWFYSEEVNLTYNSSDDISGIADFSYTLSTSASVTPDRIPESSNIFTVTSGKNYFRVRARDKAGNWGDYSTLIFSVDNAPPSRPVVIKKVQKQDNITFYWSQSTDDESGVQNYRINLTKDGTAYDSVLVNSTSQLYYKFVGLPTGIYNATVGAVDGVGLWRWSDEKEESADTTPPRIQFTPTGTVVSQYPILKVWSDEQAVCYYSISGTYNLFSYTNSTYHETKVYPASEGSKSYGLLCKDMAGNEQTGSIDFTINTALSLLVEAPPSHTTYEGILTKITYNLSRGGYRNTSFYINGRENNATNYDFGNGTYTLTFVAPSKGTYTAKISTRDDESTFTLTINPLKTQIKYEDPSFTPQNTDHITYVETSGLRKGLASDSPQISSSSGELNLSSSSSIFIFNTQSSVSIRDRENLISQGRFLDAVNPAFGYELSDIYLIKYILGYDDYEISSSIGREIGGGSHQYYIVRIPSTGKKTIKIVDADQDSIDLT